MGRTVLIVDDHVVFRSLARSLLSADGWTVVGEAGTVRTRSSRLPRWIPTSCCSTCSCPAAAAWMSLASLHGRHARAAVVLVSSREAADYGPALDAVPSTGFLCKRDLNAGALDRLLN